MWNSLSVSLCIINAQRAVFIFRLIDWTECDIVVTEHRQWRHVRVKSYSWKAAPGAGLFLQTLFFKDQWRAKKEKEQWMSVSQGERCGRTVLVRYRLIALTLPFFFSSPTGKNFVNPLSFCQKAPTEMIAIKSFDSASPAGTGFL